MLIGPLWWLQHTTLDGASLASRLGIISGFIILFTVSQPSSSNQRRLTPEQAVVSVVTVASAFEVLAATAAYSAVLMVFVQIGSNTSGSGS